MWPRLLLKAGYTRIRIVTRIQNISSSSLLTPTFPFTFTFSSSPLSLFFQSGSFASAQDHLQFHLSLQLFIYIFYRNNTSKIQGNRWFICSDLYENFHY
ncbi:hypothetical protein QVD17_23461 [Tagetes erecta]|uniref:Uncharacterized protein n=1 Tax=Tagetes erecta TaxID=13708 RepID=A0AAD8KE20_TARER|nr:hypothetical protein QVD17_23461 [Tagetes erecta]